MAQFAPPGIEGWESHSLFGLAITGDGHLRTSGWIFRTSPVDREVQRLILIGLVAIGFLCVYYLPLRLKRPPLVVLTLLGLAAVLGLPSVGLFLAWHLFAYATFHPHGPK